LDREVFDTLLEANVLRRRVMAVVAPLSSRNISRDGSIAANSSHQATRSVFISGRFFSAARSDFFCAWDGNEPGRPGWSPTQVPHRSGRARQRGIRLFIS
jgi:hypothetical protein